MPTRTKNQKIADQLNAYMGMAERDHEVAFIALYGSQNYHLDTPDSDIDAYCVVLPSPGKLTGCNASDGRRAYTTDHGVMTVKTIDEMAAMYLKQSINFCETLFTDHIIVNPVYANEVEMLHDNAGLISSADIEHQVRSTLGMLANECRRLSDRSRPAKGANKRMAHIMHCAQFIDKRCDLKPFVKCIDPRDRDEYAEMLALKRTPTPENPGEVIALAERANTILRSSTERFERSRSALALRGVDTMTPAKNILQSINVNMLRMYLQRI